MRMIHLAVASLLLVATAVTAQEVQRPVAKTAPVGPAVEAKVRKLWEDFKSKNKQGLASALADGFREMEEGGSGFGDKKGSGYGGRVRALQLPSQGSQRKVAGAAQRAGHLFCSL